MKLFNKESKKNKETRSLPMSKKGKSALTVYSALVLMLCCCTTTAFACLLYTSPSPRDCS